MPKTKKAPKEETIQSTGETLLKDIKNIIAEGNIRRIKISDKKGKTFLEFPLTVGVIAAALAPVLAAVGAVAALIGECTIYVERDK